MLVANNTASSISLNSYDSEENCFTCPSDGYLSAYKATVKIGAANGDFSENITIFMGVIYNMTIPIYVRKGMKAYFDKKNSDVSGGGNVTFKPLSV